MASNPSSGAPAEPCRRCMKIPAGQHKCFPCSPCRLPGTKYDPENCSRCQYLLKMCCIDTNAREELCRHLRAVVQLRNRNFGKRTFDKTSVMDIWTNEATKSRVTLVLPTEEWTPNFRKPPGLQLFDKSKRPSWRHAKPAATKKFVTSEGVPWTPANPAATNNSVTNQIVSWTHAPPPVTNNSVTNQGVSWTRAPPPVTNDSVTNQGVSWTHAPPPAINNNYYNNQGVSWTHAPPPPTNNSVTNQGVSWTHAPPPPTNISVTNQGVSWTHVPPPPPPPPPTNNSVTNKGASWTHAHPAASKKSVSSRKGAWIAAHPDLGSDLPTSFTPHLEEEETVPDIPESPIVLDSIASGVMQRSKSMGAHHYECLLCNVQCAGDIPAVAHLHGKNHKKVLARSLDGGNSVVSESIASGVMRRVSFMGAQHYECMVCNVTCTGDIPATTHLQGKNHKEILERNPVQAVTSTPPVEKEETNPNAVTGLDLVSEAVANGLMRTLCVMGAQHFECTVCNVTCTGDVPAVTHLQGKNHKDIVGRYFEGYDGGKKRKRRSRWQ